MKAKRKIKPDAWTPFQKVAVPQTEILRLKSLSDEEKRSVVPDGMAPEDFDAFLDKMAESEKVFLNSIYQVAVREMDGGMTHLSIKRRDKGFARDWRHFQRIKNELCGHEREAVELYPAESRLVDSANQFHLWVFPDGYQVPLGFQTRYIRGDSLAGAVQRPREEHEEGT